MSTATRPRCARCGGRIFVPTPPNPILKADGFAKKLLATWHIEIIFSCEALCAYCSSDCGLRVLFQKHTILNAVREQGPAFGFSLTEEEEALGWSELSPKLKPLSFQYDDEEFLAALERQLKAKGKGFGKGETLMFSEFTDPFSPGPVRRGLTLRVLKLILDLTSFTLRVLTKFKTVARPEFIELFQKHRERVVVGLSIGSLDDDWARHVEPGTSLPSARIRALHALQDAGVRTYAMLCPCFPHVLEDDHLERLVDAHRVDRCEHVWFEPFNVRWNWTLVEQALPEGIDKDWLRRIKDGDRRLRSAYETELYERLLMVAADGGWIDKMRYLLYEADITESDAAAFAGGHGVLLQAKPDERGRSRNPYIAALQRPNGSWRPREASHA